ncbi:UDP-glucuronosyltransferase [Methylomonas sp. LW13]|uniref:glycosyltransferase n=1 Tax=unclassified Methylomonas TaxID=2608980 RepID=UPI00068FE38D|nr:nucleotide disphospho-sugar-binding domain-containing protein [Methylomonas sp. LW13]QBC28081.1 UDP-glucuronosyltransferase [Methylomonas sp. LW13]
MSRILFAWELGANYGHLSRQLPIALGLRAKGHQVFFVVRDTTVAANLLGPHGIAFTQAPFDTSDKRLVRPPGNYAEMLLASGYSEHATLWGMVRSWLSLMRMFNADIIVTDHAPTALFAARLIGLPSTIIGSGFEIPPNCSPLPSIRPWEAIDVDRLCRSEERVLERLNAIAIALGERTLSRISVLFEGAGKILATFGELDHYGLRDGENYTGPIYCRDAGQAISWSTMDSTHIFAYLRPSVPGFEALLTALSKQSADIVVVAPGIRRAQAEALARPGFQVFAEPGRLDSGLLKSTDIAITYGGIGTVSACLLAGIPLLLVPQNIEQYLMGQCIENLTAGLVAKQCRTQGHFSELLERLLCNPIYRQNAVDFANRYADFKPHQVIDKAVYLVETMLSYGGISKVKASSPGSDQSLTPPIKSIH